MARAAPPALTRTGSRNSRGTDRYKGSSATPGSYGCRATRTSRPDRRRRRCRMRADGPAAAAWRSASARTSANSPSSRYRRSAVVDESHEAARADDDAGEDFAQRDSFMPAPAGWRGDKGQRACRFIRMACVIPPRRLVAAGRSGGRSPTAPRSAGRPPNRSRPRAGAGRR
jgi:hypothetical protein